MGLRVGDDVTHDKFGEGVILELVGDGDKAEAVVHFRDVGEKRLLLAWAPLAEDRAPELAVRRGAAPASRCRRSIEQLALAGADRADLGAVAVEVGARELVVVAVDERVDRAPPAHPAVLRAGQDVGERHDLAVLDREEDVAVAAERVGHEVGPAVLQLAA